MDSLGGFLDSRMAIGFLKRGYEALGATSRNYQTKQQTTWEKKAGEVPRHGPHTYYVNWNMDMAQHGTYPNREQEKGDFVIYQKLKS